MFQTQKELDLHYYSRWEIASARQEIAESIGWWGAIFAAVAADLKWDNWVWDIAALIVVYVLSRYDFNKEADKAWKNYENRPILNKTHEYRRKPEFVQPIR